jgi:hypothetical protein
VHGYTVELLYRHPPTLDATRLFASLQSDEDCVEQIPHARQSGALVFTYPGLAKASVDSQRLAPRTLLSRSNEPLAFQRVRSALQQTWDWPDANTIVPRHQAVVTITDFQTQNLEYKRRLALIHAAVSAVLAQTVPLAIHWQPSECLVSPETYLSVRAQTGDLVFPAIHVRHFKVENPLAQETVSDTLGMAPFGLPDFQCYHTGLSREAVTAVLQRCAYDLFAHGVVLPDGATVEGVRAEQRWACHHELALVGPVRDAITLNPGPAHVGKYAR